MEIHYSCRHLESFRRISLRRYTNELWSASIGCPRWFKSSPQPGHCRIAFLHVKWTSTPQQGMRFSRLCENVLYRWRSRGETQLLAHFTQRRLPPGFITIRAGLLVQEAAAVEGPTAACHEVGEFSVQKPTGVRNTLVGSTNFQLHSNRPKPKPC